MVCRQSVICVVWCQPGVNTRQHRVDNLGHRVDTVSYGVDSFDFLISQCKVLKKLCRHDYKNISNLSTKLSVIIILELYQAKGRQFDKLEPWSRKGQSISWNLYLGNLIFTAKNLLLFLSVCFSVGNRLKSSESISICWYINYFSVFQFVFYVCL